MAMAPPARATPHDLLEAGTAIVWDEVGTAIVRDVDTIAAYHAASSDVPVVYIRGQVAEAEPSVPGWRLDVAWVFA